ncbi:MULTISPECIES: outer membrane protein assembly factor BamD [Ehrlichia]|nr:MULTISPECIES: outer membrane protein assembly factor BamD [Ehrlichia]OUC04568.1 competence protein ComL [Ehrlichia sp. Wisconsin_h]
MHNSKVIRNTIYLLCCCFLMVNCSFIKKGEKFVGDRTADEIYESALRKASAKEYKSAVKDLEEIDNLYPFSPVAIKARLMMSFLNYELGDYSRAEIYADDYIQLYPDSKDIDFAYYLRIMANYMQISDIDRDQSSVHKVLELLNEFIHLFPSSVYLEEVMKRLELVHQHVAGKEFSVGKFYLQRGEYVAAIKRFSTVLNKYKDTKYYSESLYRIGEAYLALGDVAAYARYMSLLKECCMDTGWYKEPLQVSKVDSQ